MEEKTIGIIGGMGPGATVELFRMIVQNTRSSTDQGHIRILIDNNPKIPDRTAAILSNGPSPVPAIIESARKLQEAGADFLIIPCNTSHYFFDRIQAGCDIPILNMIEETAKVLKKLNTDCVGLLATTGTIQGGIYERFFHSNAIRILHPDPQDQKVVMDFIYSGVKAGKTDYRTDAFMGVVQRLFDRGARTMILGCTEIPVGMEMYQLRFPCVDAMKVLAQASIRYAGYELGDQN